ncbi:RNA polymerase sigma factor [Candidatus Caldatribacterium saccharofermentans]|uniref:Sigma-70 family RNA polymerase sigma factor n=1 Tax=Candidatus Caldatribacterium saccharofermentans TaxID=1454753 RepID=A0A7V4WJX3_9BACT
MSSRHLFYLWNRRLKEEGLGVGRPWREVPLPPEKMERLLRLPRPSQKRRIALPLEVLSPKQRRVVELLFFEGLSEKEAAERLGISRRSVRIHKRRALKKLRETLNCSQNRHSSPKESSQFCGTVKTTSHKGRLRT